MVLLFCNLFSHKVKQFGEGGNLLQEASKDTFSLRGLDRLQIVATERERTNMFSAQSALHSTAPHCNLSLITMH